MSKKAAKAVRVIVAVVGMTAAITAFSHVFHTVEAQGYRQGQNTEGEKPGQRGQRNYQQHRENMQRFDRQNDPVPAIQGRFPGQSGSSRPPTEREMRNIRPVQGQSPVQGYAPRSGSGAGNRVDQMNDSANRANRDRYIREQLKNSEDQQKRDAATRQQMERDRQQNQQNRANSSLYPNDDRNRKALDQLMRHDDARRAVQSGTIRSLTDIRGQVRRQFSGRIVGVELYENRAGGGPDWIYDVRVLNQRGEVMAVEMDARTGNVLGVKGHR